MNGAVTLYCLLHLCELLIYCIGVVHVCIQHMLHIIVYYVGGPSRMDASGISVQELKRYSGIRNIAFDVDTRGYGVVFRNGRRAGSSVSAAGSQPDCDDNSCEYIFD